MKARMLVGFLVITLTACAPTQINTTDVQNTAIAIVQTEVALTQMALPPSTTVVTNVASTPSQFPTQPTIVSITPNAIQLETWREYEAALAKNLLPKDPPEVVLCEWVILGQSSQKLYVVAVCLGNGRAAAPAVIHLDADGSINNVEAVAYGSTRDFNIQRLFPPDIQEAIYSESIHIISEQLKEHLSWRLSHREEPPSIVLSAIPTVFPTP